jgi:Fe-S cluster assembly scaffold protein SufB
MQKTINKAYLLTQAEKKHQEYVAKGDTLNLYAIDICQDSVIYNLDVYLDKFASVNLKAVSIGNKDFVKKFNITIHHEAEEGHSNLDFQCVGIESSKVAVNILSKIGRKAYGSSTYQNISGILLSDNASIVGDPNLEIDNNDIKAKHAFSVGALSQTSIFYLMSRGMTRSQAEQIIISGIFQPAIKGFEDEKLMMRLNTNVNDILNFKNN